MYTVYTQCIGLLFIIYYLQCTLYTVYTLNSDSLNIDVPSFNRMHHYHYHSQRIILDYVPSFKEILYCTKVELSINIKNYLPTPG